MIKVGQKVRFNPFSGVRQYGLGSAQDIVDGIVNYVHPTNGWFNVRYNNGDGTQLLGFRFDDINKTVKLVK
jgi:hypothetical protein